jgi:hypothetical protein
MMTEGTTTNLISIQDEYIATINAGIARWSHRKEGGHSSRILRGAYHQAERKLQRLGLTAEQIKQALHDAKDIAELERNAE